MARFLVPYVCNGCITIGKCTILKHIYDALHANLHMHKNVSAERSDLCVSEEEVRRINQIITLLVKQNQ